MAGIFDPLFIDGGGDYPVPVNAAAWAAAHWDLSTGQTCTFVDGRSQTSSLVGDGECPITSGDFGNDQVWGQSLNNLTGKGLEAKSSFCDVDGPGSAHYGDGNTKMTGHVDLGAQAALVEANLNQPFGLFSPTDPATNSICQFDEAPASNHGGPSFSNPPHFSGQPFTHRGGTIPGMPVGAGIFFGVSNGWTFGGGPSGIVRWRGRLLLPAGQPKASYFIGRFREALIASSGIDIRGKPRPQQKSQVDILSAGIIHPGQVIGLGQDIGLPDPGAATFGGGLGPDGNPIITDFYFAVVGQSPAFWALSTGNTIGALIFTQ